MPYSGKGRKGQYREVTLSGFAVPFGRTKERGKRTKEWKTEFTRKSGNSTNCALLKKGMERSIMKQLFSVYVK
jgi:hypothetical protein